MLVVWSPPQTAQLDPKLTWALGIPLPTKTNPNPERIPTDIITNTTIYDCIAAPHPSDITAIMNTLIGTTDVTSCLTTINTLKANKGLALADILTALAEELGTQDVPAQTRVLWLEGLAEVEWRLSGGGGETVQTGALVGVVRGGCEVVENGR